MFNPVSADDLRVVKWYVDASFAVHPDFKSHIGAVMTLGKGVMQSIARKQKMKVQSSTEGKLVAVDDAATMICGQSYSWNHKDMMWRRTSGLEKGNAQIEHFRTDNMAGDFLTKPLQVKKSQCTVPKRQAVCIIS
jgi:hypothetical protein